MGYRARVQAVASHIKVAADWPNLQPSLGSGGHGICTSFLLVDQPSCFAKQTSCFGTAKLSEARTVSSQIL